MALTSEVVICGAGIAGISAAYHLAVQQGIRDILLVEEGSPLSLTSDKSTECYRNWWPGPGDAMVALMNRSIDLLEELAGQSNNVFHMNRRGYLYLTADPAKIPAFETAASEPPTLGAGPLRLHRGQAADPPYQPALAEGYTGQPDGADLLLDQRLIRQHFPYLSEGVVAALHVRRAGWFSAQQLGMHLLEQGRARGVKILSGQISRIEQDQGRVTGVLLSDGRFISTRNFVNAAGPYLPHVGRIAGAELPVFSELHLKVAFKDILGAVPRNAPLLIWTDPQFLTWSAEERALLESEDDTRWLLDEMPTGAHTRPEGGADSDIALMLWEYHDHRVEPTFPPPLDEQYPEIALRGLVKMLPALQAYIGRAPRPVLDGGYYTKTRENRPLIGPMPLQGTFVIGALSGFGLMAAMGAGELLAAHLAGTSLPHYAPAFMLQRYEDPQYLQLLARWGDSGQL